MRRASVLLVIVAAVLLVLPAAAMALGAPEAVPFVPKAQAPAAQPMAVGTATLSPSYALTGTGVIKLNLYDSWSSPQTNATVAWFVWGDADYGTGTGSTDGAGHVELTGVPEAPTSNGEIVIWSPNPGDYVYDLWNMSWPATGTDMGVQPGRQAITVTAGGDWSKYWQNAWIDLFSTDGSTQEFSETRAAREGTITEATGNALKGDLTGAAVYFYMNEGRELDTSGITASPGQDTSRTLSCDEYGAPRMSTSNTSWDSGKPGSAVKVFFKYFPAGWVNDLSGRDDDTGKASTWHSSWTSPGKGSYAKTLKVPTGAKPGHTYLFLAQHRTGPLGLAYPFQVCTLNASDTTPRAGQTIRLSGVVPVNAPNSKRVMIYKRFTSAGQPQYYGGPAAFSGWTRVGYAYANSKGFYSKSVTAKRTTYYCVFYPSDKAGHWAAWTSVRKVTVR